MAASNGVDFNECFEAAVELAKEAGELIRTAINREKHIEEKSSAVDLVTETDEKVEELLISGLRNKFPGHKFIGEESVSSGESCDLSDDPTWIIDPVDGTMNFVHSFPFVAVSIALLVKKKTHIGIVYNAILDHMYTARLDQGAFCNGKKLQVSGQEELDHAILMAEIGSSRDPEKLEVTFNNLQTLVPLSHGLRSMGSAALNMCLVACGAGDAYYEFGIHCWDIAAGDLIVREAKGIVIDTEGKTLDLMKRRVLCASSEKLAYEISQRLQHMILPSD